ncbi:MAG: hypothetical protein ABW092_01275 [Candidatus Thiodiazotropha sp.]
MEDEDLIFSISEQSNYLCIDVKRPMTIELARRCGEGIATRCRENNINRFLIDLRGAPSLIQAAHDYHFAHRDMKDINMPRNHRGALLVDPEDQSHNFFETVMVNTGYATRVFRDKQSAITWLLI